MIHEDVQYKYYIETYSLPCCSQVHQLVSIPADRKLAWDLGKSLGPWDNFRIGNKLGTLG